MNEVSALKKHQKAKKAIQNQRNFLSFYSIDEYWKFIISTENRIGTNMCRQTRVLQLANYKWIKLTGPIRYNWSAEGSIKRRE